MKKPTTTKKTLPAKLHHQMRMAVVPHKKNKYRPHLVRWHGIVAVLVAVVGGQLIYNLVETGSVLGQETTITSEQLLAKTNQARIRQHLAPLKLNAELNQAARLKANNMFKEQYWAHTSPEGETPWQWFKATGYNYSSAGENLARGFHTSAGTVTAWMNSAEHRANILNGNFQDVGFAVVNGKLDGEETSLVVALYGAPVTATVASAPKTVLAAADQPTNLVTRLGVGIQSMTPAVLGSIMILLLGTVSAIAAHAYRKKLPKPLRESWYRHHGLYKAVGMTSLVLVLLMLYGGGQV